MADAVAKIALVGFQQSGRTHLAITVLPDRSPKTNARQRSDLRREQPTKMTGGKGMLKDAKIVLDIIEISQTKMKNSKGPKICDVRSHSRAQNGIRRWPNYPASSSRPRKWQTTLPSTWPGGLTKFRHTGHARQANYAKTSGPAPGPRFPERLNNGERYKNPIKGRISSPWHFMPSSCDASDSYWHATWQGRVPTSGAFSRMAHLGSPLTFATVDNAMAAISYAKAVRSNIEGQSRRLITDDQRIKLIEMTTEEHDVAKKAVLMGV